MDVGLLSPKSKIMVSSLNSDTADMYFTDNVIFVCVSKQLRIGSLVSYGHVSS